MSCAPASITGFDSEISAQNLECMVAIAAIPVDREIIVEARNTTYSEPLHHGEARAVNNREFLVEKCLPNSPSGLQIGERDFLDMRDARANALPKLLGSSAVDTAI
jgi:hypothetical protein